MARKKTVAQPTAPKEPEMRLEDFDMTEVYRLVHLDQIPGYQLLKKERDYLAAYRQALRLNYERNATPVEDATESE